METTYQGNQEEFIAEAAREEGKSKGMTFGIGGSLGGVILITVGAMAQGKKATPLSLGLSGLVGLLVGGIGGYLRGTKQIEDYYLAHPEELPAKTYTLDPGSAMERVGKVASTTLYLDPRSQFAPTGRPDLGPLQGIDATSLQY